MEADFDSVRWLPLRLSDRVSPLRQVAEGGSGSEGVKQRASSSFLLLALPEEEPVGVRRLEVVIAAVGGGQGRSGSGEHEATAMSPFLRIGFSSFEMDPGLAYHEEALNPYCAVYMKEVVDTGQFHEHSRRLAGCWVGSHVTSLCSS